MIDQINNYSFPTNICFGPGSSKLCSAYLKERDYQSVLLVSDKNLIELEIFKSFYSDLKLSNVVVEVFSDFKANPDSDDIKEGRNFAKGKKVDCLIGFGGGASIDTARALSLMMSHDGSVIDYDDAIGGDKLVKNQVVPLIAIPTTSGTGSEVGRSAVIADASSGVKKIIFHPSLIAEQVFCDPVLTLELPPQITAATGIDALTHLIEAYFSKGFHPMADGMALEGIKLVGQGLARAVNAPDLNARTIMMAAAMIGAVSFQKGLGVIHSCAHSLSANFNLHHGVANGIMLPYGVQFNLTEVETKAQLVTAALGHPKGAAEDLVHYLFDLISEIRLPTNLGAFKIESKDIDILAKSALEDSCHECNPRAVLLEDFQKLFELAL